MQWDENQEDYKIIITLLALRARSKENIKKKLLKTQDQSANSTKNDLEEGTVAFA